jgi:hypothetical protein
MGLQFSHTTFEIPVQRRFFRTISTVFLLFLPLPLIAQEIKAAEPGPEYTATAGAGPFHVNIDMLSKATQRLRIVVRYSRVKSERVQREDATPNVVFSCMGFTKPSEQIATVECNPPLATLGGNYGGPGTITLSRDETGESKDYTDIRLPIVTLVPNPSAASDFPVIVSTSLSLDSRQSLEDGSRKSQDVLNSLSAHIKSNTPNSNEVRAYLRGVAEQERGVIDLTRRRYLGDSPDKKAPIFFEDFDRRLKLIIRELGGTPHQLVAKNQTGKVHFLLAQMPHTSDSITVNGDHPATVSHSLQDLVGVLTDAVKGLLGMSETGTTNFHWSATTIPQGAEIFISRLDEPETKWAGATDVKDTTLEYAIWTFRFDWNGCSRKETPDPFLQHPLNLKLAKEGCRRP